MTKFKSNSLIFIALFFVVCSFSSKQNNDDKAKIADLLKKSKNYYDKQKQFKFNTTYDLFAGNTKKAIESYNGIFIKKDKNYYSKIGQTEFIFSAGNTLKIDNESKLIQFVKDENKVSSEKMIYDLTNHFDNFGTFELKSNETQWICILHAREVTFVPYSKIVIYLSKKDYSILKQELFLISQIKIKNDKGKEIYVFPKLQITFTNLASENQNEDFFKINNYIEERKGKYYPIKKYSSYQIVD